MLTCLKMRMKISVFYVCWFKILARNFVRENTPETLTDPRININLPQNLAKAIGCFFY
jgi:hypothetical protein